MEKDDDHSNALQNSQFDISATMASSSETIVFDSKLIKTSTQVDDFAATWGGRSSLPDSGRLRRAQSWSAGPPDDVTSEIRILRERQRLTLFSLALVDFMSFCSMSIMAPFFPREASIKGLSATMCGMLPILGVKFMFTAGMFMAGGCNVIFGTLVLIEDTNTFTILCFIIRGMEALGASAYSTASYVYVVNVFPDNIGSVLGILETFVGLGMSVGPAIGGLLYSIGGFGVPFYSLGIVMIIVVPINMILLPDCEEYVSGSKTASILRLFKIPSIIITGFVIVIVSNTWAFLDPTLEPHLRQFNLSTRQIGLIFLLFSSLYGIFSPIWGWVADRFINAVTHISGCFNQFYGVVTLTFFTLRESTKWIEEIDTMSDSIPYTDSTWTSNNFIRTHSAPPSNYEYSPLVTTCSCSLQKNGFKSYGATSLKLFCPVHKMDKKSGSASVAEIAAYLLKFQFITDLYIKVWKFKNRKKAKPLENEELYQYYIDENETVKESDDKLSSHEKIKLEESNKSEDVKFEQAEDKYCSFIDNAIFGPPSKRNDSVIVKRNNAGLVAKLENNKHERSTDEIIRHNLHKDGCECKDGYTYVRGTVMVSSTGACEV
ncbi:unnamed protein product [Leptidea sinapis]|uniref:Major facilitator superfamily (MFS) profile domain-containing protein n=1 Tax=Leptidea sinapis TaxID=189913 RepID=A0A5E4PQ10_9NEOP|nr:unnamed protein product [Leptidea sinapis]